MGGIFGRENRCGHGPGRIGRIPVLAIRGERDELIPVAESRAAVARALARGYNRNVTCRVFAGADHNLNRPSGYNPVQTLKIKQVAQERFSLLFLVIAFVLVVAFVSPL
jgi:pimeloyl-ACP methyl ester carboxylesterase